MRHVSGSPADERRARFEALAAIVYEPLQRYVRRRHPAAGADDVVADALLVCWRRLDDVPADAELAWCYGVARRCLATPSASACTGFGGAWRNGWSSERANGRPDTQR